MHSLPVCDFSDQPRIICSCKDHKTWRLRVVSAQAGHDESFDFDELSESEHEFFGSNEFLEQVQQAHRAQAHVALASPKTSPWAEPKRVRVSLKVKGAECEVCHENPRGSAFVCQVCMSEVEALLVNLPALLAELRVQVERQDRTHSGTRAVEVKTLTPWDHALRNTRVENGEFVQQKVTVGTFEVNRPNPTANESIQALAAANYDRRGYAVGAERAQQALNDAICQAVMVVNDRAMDIHSGSVWLMGHLTALAGHPTAPKLIAALTRACRRAYSQIDNVATGTYLGLCQGDYTEGRICRAPLYADLPKYVDDPQEVTCPRPSCGRVYDIKALWQAKNEAVYEHLYSVDELVDLSAAEPTTFGRRLTEGTLRRWIAQHRLLSKGSRPRDGREPAALYRAGDVLDLGRQFARAA